MIFKDLASMRSEYDKFELNENMLLDNPLDMFALWFEKVVSNFPDDANSMILSTANKLGKPSARVVLLKGIEDNAFIFYTNYLSQKAKDIEENPQVSLLFFWQAFHRQVRIEGTIEKVSRKTSEQYFNTRPLESRIGAIASNQSEKISKEALEKKIYSISQKKESEIVCPQHWGGFAVNPLLIEFWQGRPSRIHDRICYEKINETWSHYRLSP
jgi:pyridoxamine 5'-phosphate oxidase